MVQLFIILFSSLKYVGLNDMVMHGVRFGDVSTLSGNTAGMVLSNNQNNIAYYCVLALSCMLILIYKYKANKIAYYFLLSIPVIFGLLTVSRSFILVAAFILILYMVFMIKKSKKNIFHLIYLFAFLLLGYFLALTKYPDLFQNIFNRFQSQDVLGGRGELFAVYNHYLFSHLDAFLVGTGLFPMVSTVNAGNVPHNGFQQVLVAYGIIGLCAFLFLLYLILKNAINKQKVDLVFYLPFIAMIVFIQTLQLLDPYELMMPIIIAFCSIRLGAIKKEKIQPIM
jgi:O-antigen ligase